MKGPSQTKIKKTVIDARWTKLRTKLKYKCENARVLFEEVNEAYTTQTCSCCGSRLSSPKGRAGLGIREWQCMECGKLHDRYLLQNNINIQSKQRIIYSQ